MCKCKLTRTDGTVIELEVDSTTLLMLLPTLLGAPVHLPAPYVGDSPFPNGPLAPPIWYRAP